MQSLMSIDAIIDLPWYVGELGLVLCALALWSAVWAMLQLRFARAATRLVFVFLVLTILTQNGNDIVRFIDNLSRTVMS